MEINKTNVYKEIEGDNGSKIVILKGKVKHLIEASSKAYPKRTDDRNDTFPFTRYLSKLLVRINGKQLTFDQIDNLHISDWVKINEYINEMMQPPKV